jgi:hypothetical protein
MQKRESKLFVRNVSLLEIFLIISMSFAIAFFMKIDFVSSATIDYGAAHAAWKGPIAPVTNTPTGALGGISEGFKAGIGTAGGGPTYKLGGVIDTGLTGVSSHLLQGAVWAGVVYGVVQLVGPMLGLDKKNTNALALAGVAGVVTFKAFQMLKAAQTVGGNTAGLFTKGILSNPIVPAIAVAVIVFVLLYKKTKTKTVNFTCLPYEPPLGYAKCEDCNKDPFRPCSEYRCKSLGQACELVNKGIPGKELCAKITKFDASSPTITPWVEALYPMNLKYITDTSIRPPALGVKIVSDQDDGCLPAFTPLKFGIVTNEPAQCKIDYNHTKSFEDMQYYFGEENYFSYNHTQLMRLPSPEANQSLSGSPLLKNDGTFSLYVRCRDPIGKVFGGSAGNDNVDEYAISFCVSKAPDTTPPVIEQTSIVQNAPVGFNADSVPIQVYTNEPADCKWSREDKTYDDLENSMECVKDVEEINSDLLYTCSGNLTGIKNMDLNTYFFRCKDQPLLEGDQARNTMSQSYKLDIRGSRGLDIVETSPNGTIFGSTSVIPVDMQIKTLHGSDDGLSNCFFSNESSDLDSFIKMFNTNNVVHSQKLQLPTGDYTYYFRCIDAGGNTAFANTTFKVQTDQQAPFVTRAYKEIDALKIVTDEDAECSYSLKDCSFNLNEGIKMIYNPVTNKKMSFAPWKPATTYYIKCIDQYGNEPSPNACSIVAKPISWNKEGN